MTCRVTEGCTNPIENQDTGACASCGARSRKLAKQAAKPIKSYYIPSKSKKGAQKEALINKTYKVMDSTVPHHCSNCGTSEGLTHSHILPRGQYPQFAAELINLVYDCINCHETYEHGTLEDCQSLRNWKHRLAVIKKLAPEYFFRRFGYNLEDYLNWYENK